MLKFDLQEQVHPTTSATGSYALRFEHPVLAGAAVGGWLNRAEDQVQDAPVEVRAREDQGAMDRIRTLM